ncbi:fusarubin cluster-transcription factor [Pyrenophora seminiperda CCB06]|uniref:Fusarubin cluster-transcription factor n=1 Tax=Pyrenophora seminiperda CCB06 TaxID=1302712 RepID=A0A3M7M3M0_9PLEO|nr:fusarubin cluster-transcription factor [Pyrenophora seminiperda CCB06]
MRLGKPRKHRNPDGSIKRDVSPAGSYGPLGSRMEIIPRTTSYAYESSPEPSDPFFFGPSTPEYNYQDTYMGNGFDGSQSPAYSESTSSLVGAWSDDHMMYGSQTDLFAPVPQYLPPPTSFHGHIRSDSGHSQLDMFAAVESSQSSPALNQRYLGIPGPMLVPQEKITSCQPMVPAPLPTPSPASTNLPNHDCTQLAFQTLSSVQTPPSTENYLPSLEAVLSTNKAAVDKLRVLLNCHCSSNPLFSTIINLIIMEILNWYQAIAGAHQQGERSSRETQMKAFIYPYVSPDSSDLESENTYRTNLILSELRKIEKLIDNFSERYCQAANLAETGIESGVYVTIEASLRTHIRDTFKVTMAVAPETVKRQIASRAHNLVRVNTV